MGDASTEQEVMAALHWNFEAPGFPDVRVHGSNEIETVSFAMQMRDKLNEMYGEGTHWVEPLNQTLDEK